MEEFHNVTIWLEEIALTAGQEEKSIIGGLVLLTSISSSLKKIAVSQESIANSFAQYVQWCMSTPASARIVAGQPVPNSENPIMAKKPTAAADVIVFDDQMDPVSLTLLDAAGNPVTAEAGSTAVWSSSDPTILTAGPAQAPLDPTNTLLQTIHSTGKVSVPGSPVVITATVTRPNGVVLPPSTQAFDVPAGVPVSAVIAVGVPVPNVP